MLLVAHMPELTAGRLERLRAGSGGINANGTDNDSCVQCGEAVAAHRCGK